MTTMTTSETTMPPLDVKDDHVASNGSPASVLPKSIGNKLLKHSHNADAAMKAFEGMEGQVIELTEEKSKALLRKIDWHLMPVGLHFPPIFTTLEPTRNLHRSCALFTGSTILTRPP